uniref:Uncharacterized protein n=1 Tax=Acrobeloides nanus TaxID=290746 RepID=A0A914D3N8_9BILA
MVQESVRVQETETVLTSMEVVDVLVLLAVLTVALIVIFVVDHQVNILHRTKDVTMILEQKICLQEASHYMQKVKDEARLGFEI